MRAKPLAHDRVVDELAENCERRLLRQFFGLRNRVAHAETHSEMLSQNNFHLAFFLETTLTLCYKVMAQNFCALSYDFHSFTISSSALICSRNADRPFAVNA